MSSDSQRIDLNLTFKIRFVASRTLLFLPAFTAIALLYAYLNPLLLPLILGKYALFLGLSVLFGIVRIQKEASAIQQVAFMGGDLRRGGLTTSLSSEFRALIWATPAAGGAMSIYKHNARWPFIAAIVCSLILLGLSLQWWTYDRWVDKFLKECSDGRGPSA